MNNSYDFGANLSDLLVLGERVRFHILLYLIILPFKTFHVVWLFQNIPIYLRAAFNGFQKRDYLVTFDFMNLKGTWTGFVFWVLHRCRVLDMSNRPLSVSGSIKNYQYHKVKFSVSCSFCHFLKIAFFNILTFKSLHL